VGSKQTACRIIPRARHSDRVPAEEWEAIKAAAEEAAAAGDAARLAGVLRRDYPGRRFTPTALRGLAMAAALAGSRAAFEEAGGLGLTAKVRKEMVRKVCKTATAAAALDVLEEDVRLMCQLKGPPTPLHMAMEASNQPALAWPASHPDAVRPAAERGAGECETVEEADALVAVLGPQVARGLQFGGAMAAAINDGDVAVVEALHERGTPPRAGPEDPRRPAGRAHPAAGRARGRRGRGAAAPGPDAGAGEAARVRPAAPGPAAG